MSAWYNEIDPYAAQWLRNLIAAGHIAPGVVDERSIIDVRPDDLVGFTQCHFFAGIGGWSHALRLAGWPDDRPVWTGSCPCQPLSVAGQRKGHADERHLWPAFHRLIAECRPATVFGEQVAGKDGREWLAAVRADLEGDGYACGAADLCAAGVGAPHIRQRLYWVAHAAGSGWDAGLGHADARRDELHNEGRGEAIVANAASLGHDGRRTGEASGQSGALERPERLCDAGLMGVAPGGGREWGGDQSEHREPLQADANDDGMAHAARLRPVSNDWRPRNADRTREGGDGEWRPALGRPCLASGDGATSFWSDAVWLPCRDGKYRPTQPGLFPLAHGVSARVGRLRAYGNAIVAPLAASFVEA